MAEVVAPDEVGKWKKNTGSNVSKSSRKSRHKHHYVPCIVNIKGSGSLFWEAKYCSECGKLRVNRGIYHIDYDSDGRHLYSRATEADIYKKYGSLEAFQISDYFQPYLTEEDKLVSVAEVFRENEPKERIRYTGYDD